MLTPKYLEALPQSVIGIYSRLENEILEDVARRITKANLLTPAAEWQLYKAEQLRLSSKEITARLARMTGKSEKEIRALYTSALKEALRNDERIYSAAIKAGYLSEDKGGALNSYFGSPAFSNILKAGLKNTNGLMRNLCGSAAASVNSLLSDELDLAFLKVSSGAFSADEAVRTAVNRLGDSGLTIVNYASGRRDKVDVAVRRAVLTGISQAVGTAQLGLAAQMGCDLVEVTAHLGARPTHQLFQGRIFSLSGGHPKYPEFRSGTGYGRGDGLCGWNCRHSFYPFFEGLSSPAGVPFSASENERVYRDTQKQRAYERAVRQSKRELAVTEAARSSTSDEALRQKLDRDFQRKSVVLKRREARLSEHLHSCGLLPDSSRVRVSGFGRSLSGKAVWAGKKAENGLTGGGGGGIMKYIKVPPEISSIKGMSLEVSEEIQKSFDALENEFGAVCKKVFVTSFGKGHENEPFRFNPRKVGNWYEPSIEINSEYNFNDTLENYNARIMRNYSRGALTSKNITDLIRHEYAHVMSFSDCKTWGEFEEAEWNLRVQFVKGISKYADSTYDGCESLAEAYVKYHNSEPISDEMLKIIRKYIFKEED